MQSEPAAFAFRVLRGWRLMLMQGLYLPPAEDVLRPSQRDELVADHLNERLKRLIGLNVNTRQLAEYERLGLERPSARHYALVLGEYAARLMFLAVQLGLLALALRSVAQRGIRDFMSLVFLSYCLALLASAGLLHTAPRHTTLILPILVGCAALPLGPSLPDSIRRALPRVLGGRD